jgi:hypothetical protein
MPPHCDAIDGPVVKAARKALEVGDVNLILPYVKQDGEAEVVRAFEKVIALRKDGAAVREVADLYFFETVVRVHRAGEGAPYTGLKPAGLDVGPVIPEAERAIETGSPEGLLTLLTVTLRNEVTERFERLIRLRANADKDVEEARKYVEAMLGIEVWSNKLYLTIKAAAHAVHAENR